MFGKSKDENDPVPSPVQQLQRPAAMHSGEQVSTDEASSISRGTTVVGAMPTAPTRSPSWFLATGSSARTALPAMAAASTANGGCSLMKALPSRT